MAWYYYDKKCYKIGPVDYDNFKTLAESGEIEPETRIINDKGKESIASKIKGITFKAKAYHEAEELFNLENINLTNALDNALADIPPILPRNENLETREETIHNQNFLTRYLNEDQDKKQTKTIQRKDNRTLQGKRYKGIERAIIMFDIIATFFYTAVSQ